MTSTPAPPSRSRRRIAVLVVLALVIGLPILAVVRARSAAAAAFDAAVAAHEDGDCRMAIDGYTEAGRSWWAFSPVREPAARNSEQCAAYLVPEEAGEVENWQAAIDGYDAYLETYPGSRLTQRATDARAVAVEAVAAAELEGINASVAAAGADMALYDMALRRYEGLLIQYPGTAAAGNVPQALVSVYDRAAALAAEQRWCDAVTVLSVFTLDNGGSLPLADLPQRATAALPLPLYECGLARFAEGDSQAAASALRRLSDSYPDDPLTAQARPTLIRAEVADIASASAGEVPPPTAVGGAPAGTVEVEVINDSPEQLELLFAGPEADAVTIPPCSTCSTYPFQPPGACLAGSLPTVSLDLAPGAYQIGVRASSDGDVVPYSGTWDLGSGTAYSSCFFIVTSFG